jgi:hypothetical protein
MKKINFLKLREKKIKPPFCPKELYREECDPETDGEETNLIAQHPDFESTLLTRTLRKVRVLESQVQGPHPQVLNFTIVSVAIELPEPPAQHPQLSERLALLQSLPLGLYYLLLVGLHLALLQPSHPPVLQAQLVLFAYHGLQLLPYLFLLPAGAPNYVAYTAADALELIGALLGQDLGQLQQSLALVAPARFELGGGGGADCASLLPAL